jgi:fumarate reductase subunit D
MGQLTTIAMGVMFAFALVFIFATAIETGSNDVNKTHFVQYSQNQNITINGSQTGPNSQNSVSNFQKIAEGLLQKLADAQTKLSSNNPADIILGAFGVISALTIDVVLLLISIVFEGGNFIAGLALDVALLPTPWNMLGSLFGLATAAFVVYATFKVVSPIVKWDL